MLRLVVFQGAVSTFVANAAGSLGFIGMVVKVHHVPAALALQAMIIARLGDLVCSMLVGLVLCALAWQRLAGFQSLILMAVFLGSAILLTSVLAFMIGRRLDRDESAPPLSNRSLPGRIRQFAAKVTSLDRQYVRARLPATLAYSLGLQAVIAFAMYFGARSFHLDIGFLEAALAGILSSFIGSVPITVFGGLGVYEVSAVGLLTALGAPLEPAAAMILVVRAIFFLVMAGAFFALRPPRD
jgi:uncharacterized membrane protein YbhN (UPF0104 family)